MFKKAQNQNTSIESIVKPILQLLNDEFTTVYKLSQNDQDQEWKFLVIQILILIHQQQYQTTLETYLFQLMEFTIFFTLSNLHYRFSASSDEKLQLQAVETIEIVKNYFSKNEDKNLKKLFNRINKQRAEKDQEGDEGFENSDEEKKRIENEAKISSLNSSIILSNRKELKRSNSNQQIIQDLLNKLNQRDIHIQRLEQKIKGTEQTLETVVGGHLKDVMHLKETIYRQSNQDVNEIYQVQYFDEADIIDQLSRNLLNNRISSLKQQYEQNHKNLLIKLYSLEEEKKLLQNKVAALTKELKSEFSLDNLVKKIFTIEPNPYHIWKSIQDYKGGFVFFEVFENQRPGYGIDYRQINKMMMISKAYEREYQIYKRETNEQMNKFINKCEEDNLKLQQQFEKWKQEYEYEKQNLMLKQEQREKEQIKEIIQLKDENIRCIIPQFNLIFSIKQRN